MSSFLSDAKARIQHTNKLSLAPKDIKNLADIISTEKNVLSASSKLSVDYRKAAEALKEWGLSEGDDLADILPKLSILLCHLADAQSRFSDHDGTYRMHFKSIRMREESLTALKKSKETVQTKIPGLEKKITKMSSENKDLPVLTSRLQEARSELISLENSVAIEEARLSDFKRETVREGLSLRLGAMLELAEKMTIVCEFGKMLTAEVPLERTAPGAARTAYCAAQKTQVVVEEAQRCLTEVVFNPNASAGTLNHESSSSEIPSSQSPTSDSQQPMTPRQTQQPLTDVSQGLPMELPPLYFSEAGAENPIKPSATTTSPSNIMYSAHPNHQALHTPLDNYSSLPYVSESEAPPHSYASAQTSFTNPESRPSPPLPPSLTPGTFASRLSNNRHPSDVSGEAQDRSPYLNNVVYLRGTNGAPPSAGLSNPAESIVSPTSLYSPPSSATPSEGLARPPNRYSQPMGPSSPHQYPSSLTSAELLAKTSSGSGRGESDETVANNKSRYSPHPRDPSIASGVSGLPASEGRTTNAGAFRRAGANQVATPPGSQARSIGSTQALLATDEALSTGASTLVQPLQINKRDTSSTLDQSWRKES
ncbi:hypothetical protein PCANC_03617 [Puccinia coronata f. sp. avenae]|uniref:Uncharacterized protein n=1 Tax=Puccinia coronata f. sp. avenae TaxID=200324 RepID=A0A2N5U2A3_9BASI|nr:hypothetical protein PCASD_13197 [Puccinia coronata f. sp. avenae]PLW53797.1 hypothetical protein PCANC_03617 [Puccinia coronata f. sp. avenae]